MNRNDKDFVIRRIRADYAEKQMTELDELKLLDKRVKNPANVFAYVFGSISAIIMGAGMSLVMTEIGTSIGIENGLLPGIIIGAVGLMMALLTYPLHGKLLASRKKKYGGEILEISDRLMNGN